MESQPDSRKDEYVRTDEFDDVLSSLKLLSLCLSSVASEPAFWKWVILASHNALQSACVCLLTRTDGGGALNLQSEKALLEYHEASSQKAVCEANGNVWNGGDPVYPKTLDIQNLPGLLRRLPSAIRRDIPKDNINTGVSGIDDLKLLILFRDQFTHFGSFSWSLEIAGLPRIIAEAVELIGQIAESDQYRRWNRFQESNIQSVLIEVRAKLSEW